jgi:hypothetical protein
MFLNYLLRMPAVIDTSPLIAFSSVGRLDLLAQVTPQLWIPPSVYKEIVTDGVGWVQARAAQQEISRHEWIRVRALLSAPAPVPVLGGGERECIHLALQEQCDLIMDDLAGRRAAVDAGIELRLTGSLGLLMRAKQLGLLDKIGPLIAAIGRQNIYYAPNLVERCLKEVGEA